MLDKVQALGNKWRRLSGMDGRVSESATASRAALTQTRFPQTIPNNTHAQGTQHNKNQPCTWICIVIMCDLKW